MAQTINSFIDNINLTSQNSLTHLLDFDEEYYEWMHSIKPSLYYSDINFIKSINTDSCTLISLNCQSLNAKFPEIKLLLDTFGELNKPIHVLCLQETWIENSDLIDMAQFHVDNYQLVTKNRYASAHGGLAFYIHKSWNFKIRQDTTDSPLWEEMFVDIIDLRSPSNVKFSMGNFYRPPHTTVAQLKLFIRYFSQKLTELNSNNTAFACGDYNINLLLVDSVEHSGSYFDGILGSGFLPSITLPTRLSDNSTLIDNIITSRTLLISQVSYPTKLVITKQ